MFHTNRRSLSWTLFIIGISFVYSHPPRSYRNENPMINPGMIDGDIKGVSGVEPGVCNLLQTC